MKKNKIFLLLVTLLVTNTLPALSKKDLPFYGYWGYTEKKEKARKWTQDVFDIVKIGDAHDWKDGEFTVEPGIDDTVRVYKNISTFENIEIYKRHDKYKNVRDRINVLKDHYSKYEQFRENILFESDSENIYEFSCLNKGHKKHFVVKNVSPRDGLVYAVEYITGKYLSPEELNTRVEKLKNLKLF